MSGTRVTALVALGSNLGDRLAHMQAGLAGVRALPDTRISAVSALYETAPVGGPDNQGPYLNAAVALDTGLAAGDLLARLHGIEAAELRERRIRWGARTLDLDLLIHGDLVSADPDLSVPHPRLHERRFVMVPIVDVAPDLSHPVLNRSMAALLADLPVEPGDLTRVAETWGN
ncbi:MAG: 2-amino-4-hydroxy-6-hydroxymethyldihydropteridine diphosphokinase [Qingshengfaniella sp.]